MKTYILSGTERQREW